MKKKNIILVSVIVAIVLIIALIAGSYNSLVKLEETVNESQAIISTQLQRRADLIPNFVNTVKGYSEYEQSTFTAVTEARAKVSSATNATEQAAASAELDKAIDIWVNAVTEAYPDLKANQSYIALQDELAGTENRIAVARIDYNKNVKKYNTEIRKFPRSIFASIFGFEKLDYFESTDNSVPQVNFE